MDPLNDSDISAYSGFNSSDVNEDSQNSNDSIFSASTVPFNVVENIVGEVIASQTSNDVTEEIIDPFPRNDAVQPEAGTNSIGIVPQL